MNHTNYNIIACFLSSSEINRCKKNRLEWYTSHSVKECNGYFNSSWMPRKLRRKLRHLYHCNILPIKIATYVEPVMDMETKALFDKIGKAWQKQYLTIEDDFILKGCVQ
jgi:hypothetical protein